WQAITQAPQPVQAFRSMERLKWWPTERSKVSHRSASGEEAGMILWSRLTWGTGFHSEKSRVLKISKVVSLMMSPRPIMVFCCWIQANSCTPEAFSTDTACTFEKLL